MDREENNRTLALKAELPPLENIVFRVQIDVVDIIDSTLYPIDGLNWFKTDKGYLLTYGEAQPMKKQLRLEMDF